MTDAQAPNGDMRVSNAERDEVVSLLQAAHDEGRLTAEEFESRSATARAAVTFKELAALTTDLPSSTASASTASASATSASTVPAVEPDTVTADLMRIDRRFGNVLREGPWLVPRRIEVTLAAANVRLDFTEAVINVDTVQLVVDLGIGSELTLITQPGVKVVVEHLDAKIGQFEDRTGYDGTEPTTLRIEVTGRLRAGGDLTVRAPKKNFDQRMRPDKAT